MEEYGKDSEIIKAYTQQIFDLRFIPNQNLHQIHDFCDKLMFSVVFADDGEIETSQWLRRDDFGQVTCD